MHAIGRYEVLRLIGHGGAGDVYLARDPRLERNVAIKLLHADDQRGLTIEAKALAALDHPGIVSIFEIGEHEGREFIALEYLPGRSLRELIAARTPREILVGVVAQVVDAVAAAHRANLLHGDLKPENIIVAEDGHVKVVDFGLASRIDDAERRTQRAITAHDELASRLRPTLPPPDTILDPGVPTLWGTPAYMAPEVLIGVPPTRASDVYGLGVVLYECLAGRRPTEAATIVEAIALVIDGPPARLADPLGDLVEAMLAQHHTARPTLAQVAARLAPVVPPPKRRRTALYLAIAASLGFVGAAVAIVVPRMFAHAVVPVALAVKPPQLQLAAYGAEPPDLEAYGEVLGTLLGDVTGVDAHGGAGATQAVEVAIAERGGALHATVTLVDVASKQRRVIELARPADQLAALLHDIAARVVAPAPLVATNGPRRALALTRLGNAALERGLFTRARPYLEQAVVEDPTLFEAWYGLTITLAWMQAPEARIIAAANAALAVAPAGPRRELVRGVAQFVSGKFGEARATLGAIPVDKSADQRDLMYYNGEANWHDGRHGAGFAYFQQALQRDLSYGASAVHPWQYAIATRNAELAAYYAALAHQSLAWAEFSQGHYEKLLASDDPAVKLSAQLALGTTHSPELDRRLAQDTFDAGTLRVALALAAGDPAAAQAALAATLTKVEGASAIELESLGDVVLAGGLTAGVAPIAAVFAARGAANPSRRDRRFATLGAGLTGDASQIPDGGTDRDHRLALAIRAELAGDHDAAITGLADLVADPSVHWDYAERAALLRNLRAVNDRARIDALCADTLRPAVPRYAMIVMRRLCAR